MNPFPRPWLASTLFATTPLAAAPAFAAIPSFNIVIKDHKFQPARIEVPAGQKIKLMSENQDATPEEFDSQALNREKLIVGKDHAKLYIGPLEPGTYKFVVEFHQDTAHGRIVAK